MEHIILAFVFVMLVGAISIAVSLDMKVDRLQAENEELLEKLSSEPKEEVWSKALVLKFDNIEARLKQLEKYESLHEVDQLKRDVVENFKNTERRLERLEARQSGL